MLKYLVVNGKLVHSQVHYIVVSYDIKMVGNWCWSTIKDHFVNLSIPYNRNQISYFLADRKPYPLCISAIQLETTQLTILSMGKTIETYNLYANVISENSFSVLRWAICVWSNPALIIPLFFVSTVDFTFRFIYLQNFRF